MTDQPKPIDPPAEADGVSRDRGRIATEDGLELVWRSWTPEAPCGVIAIVHGLAEHGGRYRETGEAFARAGWAVYACDLRAHGLSPDPPGSGRVHVKRFSDFSRDVDALLGLVREHHSELPLFILGHSMGGLISIRYALDKPRDLAGAIISSPALGIHPDSKPPPALRLLVRVLSVLAPRLRVDTELDPKAISRDPAVVQAYVDDPLVSSRVSARWYAEFLKTMKQTHRDAASLGVPMLLMQSGDDRLVDPEAARSWAALAPQGKVELHVWEGLYHEMFNEPEKERVRERVQTWLRERVGSHRDDRATNER
ncbi:MAG: lysophospholipase [Gammaproteobacteria bacterium]|nr:lysophospholipase [Gammaproteobacteria bacterium]